MAHVLKNASLRLPAAAAEPLQPSQRANQRTPVVAVEPTPLQHGDTLQSAQLPEALLRAQQVSLQYQTDKAIVQATRDVSFSIYQGDRFILLGPSGCGKSSLLNAAAGFI